MAWSGRPSEGKWWKIAGRDEELYASDRQLFGTDPNLYRSDETLFREEMDLYASDRLLYGSSAADGPRTTSNTNVEVDLYAIDKWLYATPERQREVVTFLLKKQLIESALDWDGALNCKCCICLEDMHAGEKTVVLPKCSHWFHASCILQCISHCWDCPICRSPVTTMQELQSSMLAMEKQKLEQRHLPTGSRYS